MSTTTNTADQDAMRVANRYAGLIEKATTLQARAGACMDAVAQYRRDARANQESAENHRVAARTIRDPNVSHQHAVATRDAEAEAAREILAARYYEVQAEQYGAAHHGLPTQPGPAALSAVAGGRHRVPENAQEATVTAPDPHAPPRGGVADPLRLARRMVLADGEAFRR